MQRNKLSRRLLLVSLCAYSTTWLVGCGGGKDNYETVDLFAAYETIGQGMSYAHVTTIVGQNPDSSTADGSTVLYRWETGRHTYLFSTLVVAIHQSLGVTAKSYTGPEGNAMENFDSSD